MKQKSFMHPKRRSKYIYFDKKKQIKYIIYKRYIDDFLRIEVYDLKMQTHKSLRKERFKSPDYEIYDNMIKCVEKYHQKEKKQKKNNQV